MTDIDKFNEKTHFLDGVLLKMLGIIMVLMRERERERGGFFTWSKMVQQLQKALNLIHVVGSKSVGRWF